MSHGISSGASPFRRRWPSRRPAARRRRRAAGLRRGPSRRKPAKQILADAAADLAKVRSFHVAGTQTDADGDATITGDVTASGAARLKEVLGKQVVEIRVVGRRAYLRAEPRLLGLRQHGERARGEARRPTGSSFRTATRSVKALRDSLTPKGLAYCARQSTGTVTKAGTKLLGGRRVIVLKAKGDRSGTNPGTLYVAASGPMLLLRIVQTGAAKPGGKHTRCTDASDTTTASDARLSAFGKPVHVAAPPHPIDLGALQGSSAPSTSCSGSTLPRVSLDLSAYTTLRLGGPAGRLVEAATEDEVVATVRAADAADEPLLVLAGGSNVAIADAGFPGTVARPAHAGRRARGGRRQGRR